MTAACPRCGQTNDATRKVCVRCGVSLSAKLLDPEAVLAMVPLPALGEVGRREAARRAALKGSVFPGLGHFSRGRWLRGAVFLLPVLVLSVLGMRDLLSAMADLTERLSNLEPAESAVAPPLTQFYRALGYLLAAVGVHLASVFDAYRIGRRES